MSALQATICRLFQISTKILTLLLDALKATEYRFSKTLSKQQFTCIRPESQSTCNCYIELNALANVERVQQFSVIGYFVETKFESPA